MSDEIKFLASYQGWKCEKRLPISDSTPNSEVLRMLSEIRSEASEKAFELTGINVAEIKSFAKEQSSGKSGSQSIASLNQPKIRARLRELCTEKSLFPFAEALFNKEMLGLLGVKISVGV
jgi:hypothetical protein